MTDIHAEERLRLHIRNLLLDYSLTHLTTDYVQFTQDAVSRLLSEILFEIPTTDPRSLLLPEDPFETLTRIYGLGSIEPFGEKFRVDKEAYKYLKRMLKTHPGKPKSETIGYEDGFECDLSIYRPMRPELTMRAIRETPKPGTNTFLKSLPATYPAFLASQRIKPVNVEDVEELCLKPEDILDVGGWTLREDTHTAVRALFKSTLALSRPGPTYKNPYLEPSSLLEDPLPTTYQRLHTPPFIPIFPRTRLPGNGATDGHPPLGLGSVGDLPAVIMPKIEVEDDIADLYKEHMVVVDGWHTYNVSSPVSVSTPTSSQTKEQMDQLFLQSSPDTDPAPIHTQVLMDAKMDIVHIPRNRRIGGAREKVKPITGDKSLASFLLPLLPVPRAPTSRPRPETACSSPEPSISMLGQPPSVLESHVPNTSVIADGDDLDVDIRKMYESVRMQDPKDIVWKEKLDEQDGHLFMDVPSLPPPNEHAPSVLFRLNSLRELVAPLNPNKDQGNKDSGRARVAHRFLKKVKGIQSLGLQLSWVPFKPLDAIPTHAELAGVGTLTGEDDLKNDVSLDRLGINTQINSLLETSAVTGRDYTEQDHWGVLDDADGDAGFSCRIARCEIILTREERRRLAGISAAGGDGGDDVQMADGDDLVLNDGLHNGGKHNADDDDKENKLDDPRDSRPAKRARMEPDCDDERQRIDDSGIAFALDPRDVRDGWLVDDMAGSPCSSFYQADLGSFTLDANKENEPPMLYPGSGAAFSSLLSDDFVSFSLDGDQQNSPLMPYPESTSAQQGQYFYESRSAGYPNEQGGASELRDCGTHGSEPLLHASESNGEGGFIDERGGFLPLSFDSHQAVSARPSQLQTSIVLDEETLTQDDTHLAFNSSHEPMDLCEDDMHLDYVHDKPKGCHSPTNPPGDVLPLNLELATHSLGIAAFTELRAKNITRPEPPPTMPVPVPTAVANHVSESKLQPRIVPEEIFDRNTLRIPSPWNAPTTLHRYMASMDVIQKQALIRSLRLRACAVDLVERDTLAGVDFILDSHTAILLAPLLALPSQCEALTVRIAKQSWRYSRLLVIFEAFPASHSYRPRPTDNRNATTLYAYSPPILKAIKKLRRDLGIAEGGEAKRVATRVQFAFADNVDEVALFTRFFGDLAEANDDTRGATWGARDWMEDEVNENEEDLASVDGMNRFVAFVILCQISLQDFVDLSPDARFEGFGHLIGVDRITSFNDLIERRFQAMESSDPFDDTDADMSSKVFPTLGEDTAIDKYDKGYNDVHYVEEH